MPNTISIRSNICILERFGGRVYLYTHKKGLDVFNILRNALVRGADRWHDEQYLARIIMCEMLKGEDLDGTSDFGISSFIGENDLPVFMIDVVNGRILMEEGRCLATCPCVGFAWTIQDFLMLKDDPRITFLQMRAEQATPKEQK
jgi:hypothetical protein